MNVLSSDCHVVIGASHDICQDYAIAEGNIIIVSDGCSASPNSDFGAQSLARSAMTNLKNCNSDFESIKNAISSSIYTAQAAARILNLPNSCLDATLVIGISSANYGFLFFMIGDGSFAWKSKNESRPHYISVDYKHGAPEYLSYNLEPDRHSKYMSQFGNEKIETHNYNTSLLDLDVRISCACISDDLEWAAVFSDGVSSFQNTSTFDIITNLTSFKNLKGKFVKRRAKRFLRECNDRHEDDISMSAISFEKE